MIDFDKPHSAPKMPSRPTPREATPVPSGLVFQETQLRQAPAELAETSPKGRALNDAMAWAVIVMLLIAPIPMASVWPIASLFWSMLCLLALAGFLLGMQMLEPARPLSLVQSWPIVLGGLCLPGFAFGQYLLSQTGLTMSFAGHDIPLGTIAPEATLQAAFRMLGIWALFVLVFEISTRAERGNLLGWGIFAVVLAHAVWGLFALVFLSDFVIWGEKFAYQGSATGTFVNRNSFAAFLGMGLIVGVGLILQRAHRPHTRNTAGRTVLTEKNIELLLLWMLVIVIAVTMVATQSRMGSFSGFLGAWVTYLVMALKWHEKPGTAIARTSLVMAALAVVLVVGFGEQLTERALFTAADSDDRTDLYVQIAQMIRSAPWLGVGLDGFSLAYELVHEPPVSSAYVWHLTHSTYLMWWVEAGLIMGTAPILLLGAVAIVLVRTIMRRRTNYAMAVIGLGVIVQMAAHSTIDFSLEIPANLMLFVVIVAVALGRFRRTSLR